MCNSLKNYASYFDKDKTVPRYRNFIFLRLIEDIGEYENHKKSNSGQYQDLSQFLWAVSDCERCAHILYELDLLGIEARDFGKPNDFSDTHAIWHSMLKLGYWKD
jgi:hypothetical protein